MPGARRRLTAALLAATVLAPASAPAPAAAQEGIARDNLKLSAELAVVERYHDNIYLAAEAPDTDFITTVSPLVGLEYGPSEATSLKLRYSGEFRTYARAPQFSKDRNDLALTGAWRGAGGSAFGLGARVSFDSVQPWSEQETAKRFTETEARADVLLKTGTSTDVGFALGRTAVDFKDDIYAGDQYVHQAVSADLRYARFDPSVVFVGYTLLEMDVDDPAFTDPGEENSRGWRSHHMELGLRWEPTHKLSGRLQGGYGITRFKEGGDLTDLIVDTDLLYRVSEVLSLSLVGTRQLGLSRGAARERGDYYVSTMGRLSATHRLRQSLRATLGVSYENRAYAQEEADGDENEERKILGAEMSVRYTPRRWFGVAAGYRHVRTTSTIPTEEYTANIVDLRVRFEL